MRRPPLPRVEVSSFFGGRSPFTVFALSRPREGIVFLIQALSRLDEVHPPFFSAVINARQYPPPTRGRRVLDVL